MFKRYIKFLLVLSVVPILYFILLKTFSIYLQIPIKNLVFFPTQDLPIYIKYFLQPLTIITVSSLSLFLPGYIWGMIFYKNQSNNFILFLISFLISILILITITSIYKGATNYHLNSITFLILILIVLAIGLAILPFYEHNFKYNIFSMTNSFDKIFIFKIFIGFTFTYLLYVFLYDKLVFENLHTDGIESFIFSKSLKTHFLPYFDLENGYFGFFKYFMFFSYPNYFHILLLGENEASVRIPLFAYTLCHFFLILKFIEIRNKKNKLYNALLITLPMTIYILFNSFYTSWDYSNSDISEPLVTDQFFLILFLSSCYALLNGNLYIFLVFSFFSIPALASGRFLLIISLISYYLSFFPSKKSMFKIILCSLGIILFYNLLYRIYTQFIDIGNPRFTISFFINTYFEIPKIHNLFIVLKSLICISGIIPLIFLFKKKKDAISTYFTFLSFGYIILILLSKNQKIHYYIPVATLPTIVFLREITKFSKKYKNIFYILFCLSFLVPLVLYFKNSYDVHNENRDLGSKTCMQFENYYEAIGPSKVMLLHSSFKQTGKGYHTWVYYSDFTPCKKDNYLYFLSKDNQGNIILIDNKKEYLYKAEDLSKF
jgi:hypothetical protein